MKDAIKWILLAGAGYWIYENYFATPAVAAAAPAAGTPPPAGTCQAGYTGTYPNCVAPAPAGSCQPGYTGTYPNCVAPPCPTGYTGTYPNCVAPPAAPVLTVRFDSPDYGSAAWQSRVTAALTQAKGGSIDTYDDWSYFYQNNVGGSTISPALFQGILDAAGIGSTDISRGAQGPVVTAANWVSYLVAAKSTGLSGLGRGGRVRLPVPPIAVLQLPNGKHVQLRGNWRTA